ncbi:MAG: hypothetical protein WA173_18020 [Pseudomonas sp.]|uniref:hypothetical protein n=1 Tax=Pseudomonas sp. TaxID=306 RepID=UPI003BB7CBEC
MWFFILPFVMLMGMTPYMIANNERMAQQQRQAAADWANWLLIQHEAAARGEKTYGPNYGQTTPFNISVSWFSEELDPAVVAASRYGSVGGLDDPEQIVKTYTDGTRLVSVININALQKAKGNLLAGHIVAEWSKLTQQRAGAGTLQSGAVRDHAGSSTPVNLASFLVPDGSPAIIEP